MMIKTMYTMIKTPVLHENTYKSFKNAFIYTFNTKISNEIKSKFSCMLLLLNEHVIIFRLSLLGLLFDIGIWSPLTLVTSHTPTSVWGVTSVRRDQLPISNNNYLILEWRGKYIYSNAYPYYKRKMIKPDHKYILS